MALELPALPFDRNALEPYLSAETLDYHYGKHHRAHVDELNVLTEGTDEAGKSLESLIRSSSGRLLNQACEAWNHTFYWHCLSPRAGGEPSGKLATAIEGRFGSFEVFKAEFRSRAFDHFGTGWIWLIRAEDSGVEILTTHDANTPIAHGQVPLLGIDLWEHAYYIDYRHARDKYIENLWAVINWDFVAQNLD
ncbi:superoxide dismutase [Halomonas sp.]|jgi:Fe-Mn family superoxide dismutase|uniref:superoxide dismutase n=1 Tax=Halomonas sp. TaxID=1486246 RepID=UPI003562CBBD